jgi:hypothetical protein
MTVLKTRVGPARVLIRPATDGDWWELHVSTSEGVLLVVEVHPLLITTLRRALGLAGAK